MVLSSTHASQLGHNTATCNIDIVLTLFHRNHKLKTTVKSVVNRKDVGSLDSVIVSRRNSGEPRVPLFDVVVFFV